jgi:hypothetical protein
MSAHLGSATNRNIPTTVVQLTVPKNTVRVRISRRSGWRQFLALFGVGPERARFDLIWKSEPLPIAYIVSVLVVILLFEFLPYVEEFLRGLRANAGQLVPLAARNARPGQTTLR